MKIMCIGDSMGLPREHVKYEETWVSRIKNEFSKVDFLINCQRSQTTNVLKSIDCLEYYNPEIVIIQLGIVDCAPRILNRNTLFYKILSRLPNSIQTKIWGVVKKVKKRSVNTVDVDEKKFEDNLNNYLKRCEESKVIRVVFIKICTPSSELVNENPLLLNNIIKYNKIIDKVCFNYSFSINPLKFNDLQIYVDGYHPNSLGNELVFESLKTNLINIIN